MENYCVKIHMRASQHVGLVTFMDVFNFASPTPACLDAQYAIKSILDALVDMLVHVHVHVR